MDTYQFSPLQSASAVAFSPGSTFIATAENNLISIRLTASLEAVRTWTCEGIDWTPKWTVDSLQWSTTGSRVLAHSSRIGAAWAFDLTGKGVLCQLKGVCKVEWAGDDLVSWSDRGMAVHEISSGKSRFIQNVRDAYTWSPDFRYLAVVERHQGMDRIGVYDKQVIIRHFSVPTVETAGVSWSPCGKWLAVWDWHLSYSLYVYSPVGAQLGHFTPSSENDISGGIQRVVWSPNGRFLFVADSEGHVRVLESESWSPISYLSMGDCSAWCEPPSSSHSAPKLTQFARGIAPTSRKSIEFLETNTRGNLMFFGHDNVLHICSCDETVPLGPTINVISAIVFNNPIKAVRWCPTMDRLAAVTRNRSLYLWDQIGAEGVDIPEGSDFVALDLHWSPEGRSVAMCGKHLFCVVYDDGPDSANTWEEL